MEVLFFNLSLNLQSP